MSTQEEKTNFTKYCFMEKTDSDVTSDSEILEIEAMKEETMSIQISLERQDKKTKDAKSTLRARICSLEKDNRDLQNQISNLKKEVDTMKCDLEEQSIMRISLQQERTKLQNKVFVFQKERVKSKKERKEFQLKIHTVQSEKKEFEKKSAGIFKELSEKRKTVESDFETKRKIFETEVRKLTKRLFDLSTDVMKD